MENSLRQYNEIRPQESLGDMSPAEFLMKNHPRKSLLLDGTNSGSAAT